MSFTVLVDSDRRHTDKKDRVIKETLYWSECESRLSEKRLLMSGRPILLHYTTIHFMFKGLGCIYVEAYFDISKMHEPISAVIED